MNLEINLLNGGVDNQHFDSTDIAKGYVSALANHKLISSEEQVRLENYIKEVEATGWRSVNIRFEG